MALDITHIAAHALDSHSKEIADAILNHNLTSAWLKASNRIRVVTGGRTFHEKLIFAETGGFGWINKDEAIPIANNDSVTDAVYDIKVLAGPLMIYDLDKQMAQGESQVADLVETTLATAKSTMSNKMGVAIYNTGLDAKALHGLRLLVADAAGATVGGINSGTYTWFEAQRDTTGTATFNTNQAGIGVLSALHALCAGNDHDFPDLGVTTSAIWTLFQLSTTNVTRLIDTKVGALGYRTLDFLGTPIGWDANCPASHLYFLNSKYLYLRVLEGGNFVTSDWERVQGQLADYCTMHFYGQLTTNNRKKLGVCTAITG